MLLLSLVSISSLLFVWFNVYDEIHYRRPLRKYYLQTCKQTQC